MVMFKGKCVIKGRRIWLIVKGEAAEDEEEKEEKEEETAEDPSGEGVVNDS
jgi:hypothetical protein